MRNMLAFLGAVAVTFMVAGYYLGWYHVHSAPAATGHREVDIDINTKKISQDLKKGADNVSRMLDKHNQEPGQQHTAAAPKDPKPVQDRTEER